MVRWRRFFFLESWNRGWRKHEHIFSPFTCFSELSSSLKLPYEFRPLTQRSTTSKILCLYLSLSLCAHVCLEDGGRGRDWSFTHRPSGSYLCSHHFLHWFGSVRIYIYVCVCVSVLLYLLVLYHLKLNSLVLLLFNSQGEKCVQEMEAGGEAVSGSEGDSELCWLEDGRWLHIPPCSPCLQPQRAWHVRYTLSLSLSISDTFPCFLNCVPFVFLICYEFVRMVVNTVKISV